VIRADCFRKGVNIFLSLKSRLGPPLSASTFQLFYAIDISSDVVYYGPFRFPIRCQRPIKYIFGLVTIYVLYIIRWCKYIFVFFYIRFWSGNVVSTTLGRIAKSRSQRYKHMIYIYTYYYRYMYFICAVYDAIFDRNNNEAYYTDDRLSVSVYIWQAGSRFLSPQTRLYNVYTSAV